MRSETEEMFFRLSIVGARSNVLSLILLLTLLSIIDSDVMGGTGDRKSVVSSMESIVLVPVGPVDAGTLGYLESELPIQFQVRVRVGPPLSMPRDAFDSKRRQFNSSRLLEQLFDSRRDVNERWLGLTEADLFVPTLNFVFGEADSGHRTAVISLARLREEFYHRKSDPALLHQRALKEAVHELGHSYGLNHCSDFRCVMFFSNSLADTDRKSANFCEEHRKELESALKK